MGWSGINVVFTAFYMLVSVAGLGCPVLFRMLMGHGTAFHVDSVAKAYEGLAIGVWVQMSSSAFGVLASLFRGVYLCHQSSFLAGWVLLSSVGAAATAFGSSAASALVDDYPFELTRVKYDNKSGEIYLAAVALLIIVYGLGAWQAMGAYRVMRNEDRLHYLMRTDMGITHERREKSRPSSINSPRAGPVVSSADYMAFEDEEDSEPPTSPRPRMYDVSRGLVPDPGSADASFASTRVSLSIDIPAKMLSPKKGKAAHENTFTGDFRIYVDSLIEEGYSMDEIIETNELLKATNAASARHHLKNGAKCALPMWLNGLPVLVTPIHYHAASRAAVASVGSSAVAVDILEVIAEFATSEEINCRNGPLNKTPLHAAVEGGVLQSVEALIRAGADPSLRDARGRSALDIAKTSRGNTQLLFLLGHT